MSVLAEIFLQILLRSQEILNLLNCKCKMRYAKQESIAKYIQRTKANDVCKKKHAQKIY